MANLLVIYHNYLSQRTQNKAEGLRDPLLAQKTGPSSLSRPICMYSRMQFLRINEVVHLSFCGVSYRVSTHVAFRPVARTDKLRLCNHIQPAQAQKLHEAGRWPISDQRTILQEIQALQGHLGADNLVPDWHRWKICQGTRHRASGVAHLLLRADYETPSVTSSYDRSKLRL